MIKLAFDLQYKIVILTLLGLLTYLVVLAFAIALKMLTSSPSLLDKGVQVYALLLVCSRATKITV